MQYSQGQLRKTVGLTVEAYRHWKQVLPPLSSHKGHSAKFLIGDILAVAVLKRLTDICSIKVGKLSGISDEIFCLCNTVPLNELDKLFLYVDLKNNTCKTTLLLGEFTGSDVFIVVPLVAVILELRADLLETKSEDIQGQLALSIKQTERDISPQSGLE